MSDQIPPEQLPAPAQSTDSVRALVRRAEAGDRTTLPELRRLLDNPRVVATFGDMAGRVRDALLEKLAGQNLLWQEVTRREMDRLRGELLGPSSSPVERLLVERIVVAWLQVHDAELRIAKARTVGLGNRLHQRAGYAHHRFLAALRALATVRRLAVPALQVNIAEQQVNVAG